MIDKQKYRELAEESWPSIYAAYEEWKDKKPVLEYLVRERKICVYPCQEYKKTLSKRDKAFLTRAYRDAIRKNKFIVFIRDNEEERLVSTTFDIDSEPKLSSNEGLQK